MTGCGRIGYDALSADVVEGANDASSSQTDSNNASDDAAGMGDDGATACAAPTSGLLVNYGFDETSGTAASDGSGNGSVGTLSGTGGPNWAPGRTGNALSFDGVDNQVSAAPNVSMDDLSAMTVCASIFPRSFGASGLGTIVDKSSNGLVGGWNFYVENFFVIGFETNYGQFAGGGSIALGNWYHACASWDGSTGLTGISLYVDGVSVPQVDTGMEHGGFHSDASRVLNVGLTNGGAREFDGLIENVRLYNRVLTPTEILSVAQCL